MATRLVVVAERLYRRWQEGALEHSGPVVPVAAAAVANIDSMPRNFDTPHMLHMDLGSHHNIAHTAPAASPSTLGTVAS